VATFAGRTVVIEVERHGASLRIRICVLFLQSLA